MTSWSGIFGHSVIVNLTWGPSPETDLRPGTSLHTEVGTYREDLQFNNWTISQYHSWTEPQLNLRWTWVCCAVILWNFSFWLKLIHSSLSHQTPERMLYLPFLSFGSHFSKLRPFTMGDIIVGFMTDNWPSSGPPPPKKNRCLQTKCG